MGKRGPAKKPSHLRILHGDEERYINRDEPQPLDGLPDAPVELDEGSSAIWEHVIRELDAMGLAHRSDRDQLHAYVEAVWLHAKATVLVHQGGALIKDGRGFVRTNPAVRVQREAARTMLVFAREFGLTPASRVQFTTSEVAQVHAERLLSS